MQGNDPDDLPREPPKELDYRPQSTSGCDNHRVTFKCSPGWNHFNQFFPHGQIPIPNSPEFGQSVEGIWQGLKEFEKEGIDPSKWTITNMKGVKRGGTSRGKVLGHRLGTNSNEHLGYFAARRQIYLPCYQCILKNKLKTQLDALRNILQSSKCRSGHRVVT